MSVVRGASVLVLSLALMGTAGCLGRRGEDAPTATAFSSGRADEASIGVNSFLWRASLDTLAFMPLASADPYGGLIVTDWYVNPEKPDERFKATVYILDTRLRADGLNVSVSKQLFDPQKQWIDAAVTPQTEIDIENAILTRARQLRLSTVGG